MIKFGELVKLRVAVKGNDTLRLEVDNGDGDLHCDHSTWGNARIES